MVAAMVAAMDSCHGIAMVAAMVAAMDWACRPGIKVSWERRLAHRV